MNDLPGTIPELTAVQRRQGAGQGQEGPEEDRHQGANLIQPPIFIRGSDADADAGADGMQTAAAKAPAKAPAAKVAKNPKAAKPNVGGKK